MAVVLLVVLVVLVVCDSVIPGSPVQWVRVLISWQLPVWSRTARTACNSQTCVPLSRPDNGCKCATRHCQLAGPRADWKLREGGKREKEKEGAKRHLPTIWPRLGELGWIKNTGRDGGGGVHYCRTLWCLLSRPLLHSKSCSFVSKLASLQLQCVKSLTGERVIQLALQCPQVPTSVHWTIEGASSQLSSAILYFLLLFSPAKWLQYGSGYVQCQYTA